MRKFIRRNIDDGYLINGCRGDRIDNQNLIEEWKTKMSEQGKRHTFITERSQLLSLNISDYDHIFGKKTKNKIKKRDKSLIKVYVKVFLTVIICCTTTND